MARFDQEVEAARKRVELRCAAGCRRPPATVPALPPRADAPLLLRPRGGGAGGACCSWPDALPACPLCRRYMDRLRRGGYRWSWGAGAVAMNQRAADAELAALTRWAVDKVGWRGGGAHRVRGSGSPAPCSVHASADSCRVARSLAYAGPCTLAGLHPPTGPPTRAPGARPYTRCQAMALVDRLTASFLARLRISPATLDAQMLFWLNSATDAYAVRRGAGRRHAGPPRS